MTMSMIRDHDVVLSGRSILVRVDDETRHVIAVPYGADPERITRAVRDLVASVPTALDLLALARALSDVAFTRAALAAFTRFGVPFDHQAVVDAWLSVLPASTTQPTH